MEAILAIILKVVGDIIAKLLQDFMSTPSVTKVTNVKAPLDSFKSDKDEVIKELEGILNV